MPQAAHKVIEMRRERKTILDEAFAKRKKYRDSGEDLPSDEATAIDGLLDRADQLLEKIEREERMIDAESSLEGETERSVEKAAEIMANDGMARGAIDEVERELETSVFIRRLAGASRLKRSGFKLALTRTQRERLQKAGVYRTDQATILERMQDKLIDRTQQTVGTDADGGFLVPEMWADSITGFAEKEYGMLEAGAQKITLDGFGTMNFPHDGLEADAKAVIVAENTGLGSDKITFGNLAINPYKYSTKIIRVPYELILQSKYDIEAHVSRRLGQRFGRGFNEHSTDGTGTGQPYGYMAGAKSALTTASATAITWSELVQLYATPRKMYARNGKWQMNRTTLGKIMMLQDGDSRPIFLTGLAMRAPDTLLGKPIVLNDDMDDIATGKKPISFGDFSEYIILEEASIRAMVLVERYAELGQVGFVGTRHMGGRLIHGGGNTDSPVQYITMA